MVRSATSSARRAAADAGADAPGQELRVFADVGDQVEELLRPIGDDLAFGVGRHALSHAAVGRASTRRGGPARRAQRGEVGVGVIGAAGQRRGGDQQEALAARAQARVVGEFLRRDEAVDRGVLHRRLQVLADGQEIDVGDAQVVHHLHDLDALTRPARPSGRTW